MTASTVLQKHWGIQGIPQKTDLGVSRVTWRVESGYWLSQCAIQRLKAFESETEILAKLCNHLRGKGSRWNVPEVILAADGRTVIESEGSLWRLTKNLPGRHPDSHDCEIYRPLIDGLSNVHRTLLEFTKESPVFLSGGVSERTRLSIARFNEREWVPFTGDPDEKELLRQASLWLTPRLGQFEALPRQMVHGDWTPRNVFFDERGAFVGVLDFESTSMDPVHVDLSHTCSTILMWSGLDHASSRIAEIIERYRGASKQPVRPEDVYTAMLAHWLCHYWSWRDRLEPLGEKNDVVPRLSIRIRSVLQFVNQSV